MTEENQKDSADANPMYAEIITSNCLGTLVCVNLFGKRIEKEFPHKPDTQHRRQATNWVNKWNRHLEAEWMSIRETSATIMQRYTEALMSQGVSQEIISSAMNIIAR